MKEVAIMQLENQVDKSLGGLFSGLASGFSTMFRQEIALAKAEVREAVVHAVKDLLFLALGGFVLCAAFSVFLAAAVIGLAEVVPMWLSAIIIGVIVSITGYIFVQKGLRDMKTRTFKPEQTIESIKEDERWVRAKI
jgi:drug/metabolite transporter (DMT)-like permease